MSAGTAAHETLPATPAGVRRVLHNGVSLLFAYVLPRGATFLAAVVAARALGTRGFGLYGTAAAFAVILSIVSTLGMIPLLVREIARSPERAGPLLRSADVLKTGANALMLVVLVALAAGPLGYPAAVVGAAALLGVGYAIGSYTENLAAYFQAVERMHIWTAASALYGIVTGVAGIAAVLATRDIVWFAAAPVAGQLVALVWLRWKLPPEVRVEGPTAAADVLRLARAAAPFAAAFVALTVYAKVDVLLLAAWRDPAEVGVYAAPARFVDFARALALVAAAAVYPRLSRATGGARGVAAGRVAELLLLAMVPAAALLWLGRATIIDALFGGEYAASVSVLGLLAPALVPLAFDIFAGYALASANRMRDVATAYAGALALNIVLNAVLIPRYGAVGAAAAMLASETTLAFALAALLSLRLRARIGTGTIAVVAAAAMACAVAAMLASNAVVAATAYAAAVSVLYWRTGAVPAAEVALLRAALRLPRGA